MAPLKLGASGAQEEEAVDQFVVVLGIQADGKPLWNWVMPDISQSFSTLPANPDTWEWEAPSHN